MGNQDKEQGLYAARGVSATKEEVHTAIAGQDKGLFPGAFCKILPDMAGDPDFCSIVHADGAGTKVIVTYLMEQAIKTQGFERGLLGWNWGWRAPAIDAAVMNFDDLACVGALGPFWLSNAIGRNAKLITGQDIAEIIQGFIYIINLLQQDGLVCQMTGGETADVGDLVRTVTIDCTVTTRMRRCDVIDCNRMQPGDSIVGFSSTGQAKWEQFPNSGIGSNGLTSARHDLLSPEYKQPETFAPQIKPELVYCGQHRLADPLPGDECFNLGSALSSPTRTYLPLVKRLLEAIPREQIHGLIHCSGGGQTKIGKFGRKNLRFVKDKLFQVPSLFRVLREEAKGQTWREMHQVYNMGHRYEAVVPAGFVATCVKIAADCGIRAREVGHVEEMTSQDNNFNGREVVIHAPDGEVITYSFE